MPTTVRYKPWLQSYIISFICAVVSLSIATIIPKVDFVHYISHPFAINYILSQMSDVSTGMTLYHMAGNISVKLSLVAGKMNHVLPNFILQTFNTCNKIS